MKRLALTTALILSAAAPALAQSQLERQLGVPAGAYTLPQLVELKSAAEQTGNDAAVRLTKAPEMTASSSNTVNERAAGIIRAQALASDDGNTRLFADNLGNAVGGPIVNDRARAIITELTAAGDESSAN
ncbi:hypothetical protein [Rhodovulum euryhalinum]|uniref:DUF4168 domain-containing protein n=1 Tax=Rhodovulum euryhalinum TaxID=35805 RepID=A0A4R2KGP1_9RHOB|nr:hypothetical protein [Rhodovulum euryhalinum]TCO72921.1 hypothetical protein EV655_103150 [Rhodovulum euryhalinum]